MSYVISGKSLLLTQSDRVAVINGDTVEVGTITNITQRAIHVETDVGNLIKFPHDTVDILAELKKGRKKFLGAYNIRKWKSEIGEYVVDYGGDELEQIKVPKISMPIKSGDTIFMWFNRQAVKKKVVFLRKYQGKQAMIIEGDGDVTIYDKSMFDLVIAVARKHKRIPDKLSIKDLLPYVDSYHEDISKRIDPTFEKPTLLEYQEDIMSFIRRCFDKNKVSGIYASVQYADEDLIRVAYSVKVPKDIVKSVVHILWTNFGNVLHFTTYYEDNYFDIELKDDNVSKSKLENIINGVG